MHENDVQQNKILSLLYLKINRQYLPDVRTMKVEIEMYTDEENELTVMEKASTIIKQAKQLGFEVGEVELKSHKHEEEKEHKE